MADADFVPGLELSRGFFIDLVRPLLEKRLPALAYSAALIGNGSEVLGLDTPMSTDHHWGPRVMLFLGPAYPKWFGTAFRRLLCAPALWPHRQAALHARSWQERESGLSAASEELVRILRSRGIVDEVRGRVTAFWGRPFLVIHGGRIAEAIFSRRAEEQLSFLAASRRIGSIDLISDNTGFLEDASMRPLIRALYER